MSILWTLCNLETCKNYDEHSRKDDMFHMKLDEMEDPLPTEKVDCAENRLVQQIENLRYKPYIQECCQNLNDKYADQFDATKHSIEYPAGQDEQAEFGPA